jgi:Arc/MetJ-type ribon-helix-helix transcriptional regulator
MQITITLPDHLFAYLQTQVALGHYATPSNYIQSLIQADLTRKATLEAKLTAHQSPQANRQAGSLKGMITMAPDFDAPLEDLKNHM